MGVVYKAEGTRLLRFVALNSSRKVPAKAFIAMDDLDGRRSIIQQDISGANDSY
jgi:hypothetical protein